MQGGYIASTSAVDSAGEEGAVYLWDEETLKRVLAPQELDIALSYWSLDRGVSPAAGLLPQRLREIAELANEAGMPADQLQALVDSARTKLLAARAHRDLPRDTKQLAAWNGMMLSALVEAARTFGEPRYEAAAAKLAAFLGGLWDGERLLRARQGPRKLGAASLEDYAYVAEGLALWARWTGENADLQLAKAVAERGWADYFASGEGGWRLSERALLPDMAREPAMQDGAIASPAAVLMRVTRSLWPDYPGLGRALALSAPAVEEAPFWYASHALELLTASRLP